MITPIKHPRITEKGAVSAEHNAYIFNVDRAATKTTIKKAILEIYKVSPAKINIAQVPSKAKFVKGKRGRTASGKKAYVYLKKGDTIQII